MSLALNCEGGPFAKLPGPARTAITMDVSTAESAGQDYLKALPIKRKMRRALLEKKWIVHLYAGDTNHEEFKVLENDQVMILEIDVARSRGFNLRGWSLWSAVYKALLWGALRGKMQGVIGEPPRDDVGQELAWKQCLLWTLAETVARMNGGPHTSSEST